MSNILASMTIALGADPAGVARGVAVVKKELGSLVRYGENLKSLGESMSRYVTAPILAVGAIALKTAGDMQALEKGFAAVYKGAGDVNEELTKTREVAKLPGLGLKEAIQGATNLQAVGFAAEQSRTILIGYGNALATVGKGKSELDGVVTALSQMAAKGKVSAEEINQIAERVPQIRKVMKDAFGTADTEVLQKMGVSVEEFVAKTTEELNKLPKVSGGINNAFENMKDTGILALSTLGNAINKSLNIEGFFDKVAGSITVLVEKFQNLSPAAQKVIVVTAGLVAAAGPLLAIVGAIGAALPAITVGFTALVGPVGLVAAGVLALTAATVGYIATSRNATQEYKDQQDKVKSLETSMNPLIARYEELQGKTNKNKDEQEELKEVIKKLASIVPTAVTEFNQYGEALGINTEKAREFLKQQRLIAEVKNKDAIAEQRKELTKLDAEYNKIITRLQKGTTFEVTQRKGAGGELVPVYTKRELTNEELQALQAQAQKLKDLREGVQLYIGELRGITPAIKETGEETTKSLQKPLGLIEEQQLRLKALMEERPKASAERLAVINREIIDVQLLIEKYEKLGLARKGEKIEPLAPKTPEIENSGNDPAENIIKQAEAFKALPAAIAPASAAMTDFMDKQVRIANGTQSLVDGLEAMAGNMVDSVAGFMSSFASELGAGANSLRNFGSSLIKTLADLGRQIGMYFVKLGLPMLLSGNPIGGAIMAGGIALAAFSGAMGASAGGGGGSLAPSVSMSGGYRPNYNPTNSSGNPTLTTKISGRDLLIILEEEQYRKRYSRG